jgi:hypothetical protein
MERIKNLIEDYNPLNFELDTHRGRDFKRGFHAAAREITDRLDQILIEMEAEQALKELNNKSPIRAGGHE